jgi:hypothetical protein
MKGSTKNYTATVIDISILANPGGLQINTINGVALKGGRPANKSKIGYTPTASGRVDDYEALIVTYYSKGRETGERSPVSVKNKTWKQIHKFAQTGDQGKPISLLVTAVVWDNSRGAARIYLVSQSDLQVGT